MDEDWNKYINDYKSDYLDHLEKYAPLWEKEDILSKKYQKNKITPEDRARFARERRALVGTLITQRGFEGALVVEHIRGSQYLVRMPNGTEAFMSHKKTRGHYNNDARVSLTEGGWSLWDNGS